MAKKQQKPLEVKYKKLDELKPNPKNPRKHTEKQICKITKSIDKLGFNNPILIDKNGMIIAGNGRFEAAKLLGLESIPTVCLEHLTPEQVRVYIIADNKLAEEAGWDREILKIELEYLMNLDPSLDFDATITGFLIPEIDLIINSNVIEETKKEKEAPEDVLPAESEIEKRVKSGDLWQLGNNKLFCGNSLKEESFEFLMGKERAEVIFSDAPYNVKIAGNVTTKKDCPEFAMASGEMNVKEFTDFLRTAMTLQTKYSVEGSIHFQCMDWRHAGEMLAAGGSVYTELKNICVWDKITAGMGSLYRSQHEFVFVFKNGTAPHINNVELGKNGRYRTNLWQYCGMHASNPEAKELTKYHPTVKPVTMIMDALLDCSKPGGIVLDAFGGSGSTLIAAERTKRKARLIEIDPHYCDIILHRWEKLTGKKAEFIGNMGEAHNG